MFGATPKVSWNISRSHWTSLLDYSALIQRSTRFDFYSRTSHDFTTDFNYRFSKALSLTVVDSFIHSADPLYAAGEFTAPTAGSPNSSFLGAPSVRTSNYVDVEGDYRLNARDTLKFGGNAGLLRFSDVPNASLRDSDTVSARGSYMHQFSQRMSTGVSYDFAKIWTPSGFTTFSHRVSLNQEMMLRPDLNVSLFGGPNYVTDDFPVSVNGMPTSIQSGGWSWSAGGTITWTKPRFTMVGNAIHQISSSAGLIGSTQLTMFNYQLSARLPHHFRASASAGYNLNDRLNVQANGFRTAHYATADGSLTRDLTRDLSMTLRYGRMEQLLGVAAGNPWIDRNRVEVSINYTFTHQLGR